MKKLIVLNIFLFVALISIYSVTDKSVKRDIDLFISKNIKINNLLADNGEALAKSVDIAGNNKSTNSSSKVNDENKYNDYAAVYGDISKLIKNIYVEDVDDKKFFEASLNGMLSSLDPHSAYFSKEEYDQLINDTKGEFSGLGIEVTMDNMMVKVITPIDDSPAYKAGIKSGDYISSINKKSVIGMSLAEAVGMMRGKDGKDREEVVLTVLRSGEKQPLEFKIRRDVIKSDSVKGRAEGSIIYLRISSFTDKTYENMIKEFNRVENEIGKDKVKGLVLDLRNNPGGLLDSAVFVSGAFLDKGKSIVSIKGKNNIITDDFKSTEDQDLIPGLPMVVLINEGSASASEIVAGALQDNKRAMIVGTQSFGKGSVQKVIGLSNGGGIKITVAKYYTPSGVSIQAEGIKPDIEVKLAKLEEIDDSKLMRKEESLKGHLENKENNDLVSQELRKQLKTENESMYNKDYQLARAIDLLLGIDFYNKTK